LALNLIREPNRVRCAVRGNMGQLLQLHNTLLGIAAMRQAHGLPSQIIH
jgi:hypothetical protein